jgi:hypothetical protein
MTMLCFPLLAATTCQPFPGYTALADQNAPGNNIAQYKTLQAAYEACNDDPTCVGFNSFYFLTKTSVVSRFAERSVCLYVKTGAQPAKAC